MNSISSKNIIYFDESGNSEEGFIDIKQPFITFASHSSSEEQSKQAIKKHFQKSQAQEIKYNRLNKKQRAIHCIKILEYIQTINPAATYKVYTVYKPLFLLHAFLTFFHDKAWESKNSTKETGDPDWIFIRMHQSWFRYITIGGTEFIVTLLDLFTRFIKSKKRDDYDNLFKHIVIASNQGCIISELITKWNTNVNFETIIQELKESEINDGLTYLDTTLPCVYQLLNHWWKNFNGENFEIIHDCSWSLQKREKILTQFFGISKNNPSTQKSNIDPEKFFVIPDKLPITNLLFANSHEHYALQIADILAGVTNETISKIIHSENENEIIFNRLTDMLTHDGFLYMIPQISYANKKDRKYIIDNKISTLFKKE